MEKTGIGDFPSGTRPSITYGAILRDGKAIELVRGKSGDMIDLFFWDGRKGTTSQQIVYEGVIFHAPYLQPSLVRAVTFPSGVAGYGNSVELFWKIVGLFRYYLGSSQDEAMLLTSVVFRSWVPECDPGPITVCILAERAQLTQLRRVFHALSRLPLVLAELSRNLPFQLRPAVLVNGSWVSGKAASFWLASNSSDVYVIEAGGALSNIACAKIILCQREDAWEAWGPEVMHIALLPTAQQLPLLAEPEEAKIAAEIQPHLLLWRLHRLPFMYQSKPASPSKLLGGGMGQNLLAFVGEEPEIVKALTPLLEDQELELLARRSRNPHVAIVESVWSPSHKEKELSTAEITKRVSALLHSRGETYDFNANEIGWKLKNLGLNRRHNGKRKALRFTRETRCRIHQLAAQFGLNLPKFADCADCKGMQLIERK